MNSKHMITTINIAKNSTQFSGLLILLLLLLVLTLSSFSVRGALFIEDIDITHHIEKEFQSDPVIPFNTIDVNTNQGVVTLTGSVTNLLAKERAVHLAQTVRGVRSVINRTEVKPISNYAASVLQDAVRKALLYDAATDSYEIEVQADDNGQISLSGTVDSWAERDLAETVAKGVSGVVSVRNNIDIQLQSKRPDNEIKREVEKRLYWNALIDNGLVDVSVTEGKVSLSGAVGSAAEKRLAELDAWVHGVRTIDTSDLQVKKWARDNDLREKKYVARSDVEILAAIQDSMRHDPRVHLFDMEIKVSNGYVTLRGVVDNIQAKKAAISDARNTVGVVRVNNLIKVRSGVDLDDDEIAANIRSALLRHPFTESYEINVRVKNGAAQLNGTVDTVFEKGVAEIVAQRASGATSVRNFLGVSNPGTVTYNPYVYDWAVYDFSWYGGAKMATNKSDREIKLDIENEMFWSPFVDLKDIDIDVNAGVAILTGTVDSWMEYNAARENALEGGAISVINKLNIQ
ncbi:Osmotically-inducible protein OsmY, contains BON domain [Nitrosomonas sp. Nm51]|uniref:BON domain-containing protein n=1 Tax=Nitrosomonas sp. Nm51 TaxID=133720 RepID=UPI0008BBA593|nr:BON domain-containing protein [Nitrosomonas sp. Nm51]SEQ76199.1 Osmotically-inducible protein OsmY, contains BON domain [Nitrosomonas sp. Nm51]